MNQIVTTLTLKYVPSFREKKALVSLKQFQMNEETKKKNR